jgi:hypothetical protein
VKPSVQILELAQEGASQQQVEMRSSLRPHKVEKENSELTPQLVPSITIVQFLSH